MNIFWIAPHEYADKHLKIILEICQMMWTAYHLTETTVPPKCPVKSYKPTHTGHPVTRWVATCWANYQAAGSMALDLCEEKRKRYPTKSPHACQVILEWLMEHPPLFGTLLPLKKRRKTEVFYATADLPPGCTPIPLCGVAPEHRHPSARQAYQDYLWHEKQAIMYWKHTQMPMFVKTRLLRVIRLPSVAHSRVLQLI